MLQLDNKALKWQTCQIKVQPRGPSLDQKRTYPLGGLPFLVTTTSTAQTLCQQKWLLAKREIPICPLYHFITQNTQKLIITLQLDNKALKWQTHQIKAQPRGPSLNQKRIFPLGPSGATELTPLSFPHRIRTKAQSNKTQILPQRKP